VDDALRRRIARFQDDLHAYRESFAAPPTEAVAAPERPRPSATADAPPGATDESDSDGDRLSLRQRLASAANARHQVALNDGVAERREATSASGAIPPPP
jgi:hypothetical protein